MSTTGGHVVRHTAATLLILAFASGVVLSEIAPASAATRTGIITGRVSECGPGPIVGPPTPLPTPAPITVRVEHNSEVVATEVVTMKNGPARGGSFRFVVPVGTYEVLSSYRSQDRWVEVHAGGHSVVSFGLFACPMSGVKAGGTKVAASVSR